MIKELVEYFINGGWVVWPIMILCLAMWFTIGHRTAELYPLRNLEARDVYKNASSFSQKNLMGELVVKLNDFTSKYPTEFDDLVSEETLILEEKASKFSSLLNSIITVCPLLGLLGTVIGMIETFDSLAEMSLHASGGGIAGGISQALITTQLGLIVAIPGLLCSRIIKKWEQKFVEDVHQIVSLYRSQLVDQEKLS